jgi:hypothetical protein
VIAIRMVGLPFFVVSSFSMSTIAPVVRIVDWRAGYALRRRTCRSATAPVFERAGDTICSRACQWHDMFTNVPMTRYANE